MIKKVAIVALGVAAAFMALSFTRMGSYCGTAKDRFCGWANKQVPVEFEIERLKREVGQLIPDMKRNRSIVAQETVSVENLRNEITNTRTNLENQRSAMLKLSKDLENGDTTYVSNGRVYTKAEVAAKLDRDLAAFKRVEAELKAKEQMLEAKEKALESAKGQLDAMMDQKRDLEVQIAQLEAELKNVRLLQTRSKFQLDDTRLADVKRSVQELQNRLRAERIETEMEGKFADTLGTPADQQPRPANAVAKEVRDYLEGPKVAEQK
jgi:DNA repair exonuclease SbcCD ATPase subunit